MLIDQKYTCRFYQSIGFGIVKYCTVTFDVYMKCTNDNYISYQRC